MVINALSIAELKETFDLFDRNGDGYLTAKELGEALRAMAQHPTEQEVQDLAKKSSGEESKHNTYKYII